MYWREKEKKIKILESFEVEKSQWYEKKSSFAEGKTAADLSKGLRRDNFLGKCQIKARLIVAWVIISFPFEERVFSDTENKFSKFLMK